MVSFIPPASSAPKRHGATASGSHRDAFHRTSPTFPGSQALSDVSEPISGSPLALSDTSEIISGSPLALSDTSETISGLRLTDISETISGSPLELSDISETSAGRGDELSLMETREIPSALIKRDRFATFAK